MRTTVSVKYNLTGVKGKLPFNQLISLKSTIQGYIYCWHIGYPFGAKNTLELKSGIGEFNCRLSDLIQ